MFKQENAKKSNVKNHYNGVVMMNVNSSNNMISHQNNTINVTTMSLMVTLKIIKLITNNGESSKMELKVGQSLMVLVLKSKIMLQVFHTQVAI